MLREGGLKFFFFGLDFLTPPTSNKQPLPYDRIFSECFTLFILATPPSSDDMALTQIVDRLNTAASKNQGSTRSLPRSQSATALDDTDAAQDDPTILPHSVLGTSTPRTDFDPNGSHDLAMTFEQGEGQMDKPAVMGTQDEANDIESAFLLGGDPESQGQIEGPTQGHIDDQVQGQVAREVMDPNSGKTYNVLLDPAQAAQFDGGAVDIAIVPTGVEGDNSEPQIILIPKDGNEAANQEQLPVSDSVISMETNQSPVIDQSLTSFPSNPELDCDMTGRKYIRDKEGTIIGVQLSKESTKAKPKSTRKAMVPLVVPLEQRKSPTKWSGKVTPTLAYQIEDSNANYGKDSPIDESLSRDGVPMDVVGRKRNPTPDDIEVGFVPDDQVAQGAQNVGGEVSAIFPLFDTSVLRKTSRVSLYR